MDTKKLKTKVSNNNSRSQAVTKPKGRVPEKNKETKTSIKGLNGQIKKLNKEKRDLTRQISARDDESREKNAQIEKLTNDLKKLDAKIKGVNRRRRDLARQHSALDNELQEKREQNLKLEAEVKEVKNQNEELTYKISEDRNEIQRKDSQIEKFQYTIKEQESKIEKLSQEKSDLNQRVDNFENQLREKTEKNSKLESDIDKAKSEIEKLSQEKNGLNQDIVTRDNKLQDAEKTLEGFRADIENLKEQSKKDKVIVAQEWARGLIGMLRKVSNLAGREPQNTQGLTPRAVYEDLLTWMGKAFSEKPRPFPNSETVELDANSEDILELKSRYDWGVETPFAEGVRKKTFRVIQRGWELKLKGETLLPAVVTADQPDSEVSHE